MHDSPVSTMRTGDIASIRAVENGVVVRVTDQAIVAKNRSSKGAYNDPDREYSFQSLKKALKWIGDNEEKLNPGRGSDDKSVFDSTFDTVAKEAT